MCTFQEKEGRSFWNLDVGGQLMGRGKAPRRKKGKRAGDPEGLKQDLREWLRGSLQQSLSNRRVPDSYRQRAEGL